MANNVTLANGRVVTVTQDNWKDLANEDIAAEAARGNASNSTAQAILQSFKELAGEATSFFTYGPNGAESKPNALADKVLANPLVKASDAAYEATPTGVRRTWTDASNLAIKAGDRLAIYGKATGLGVVDAAKELAGKLAALNVTVRYVAIGGAVAAVAVAAIVWAKR